MTQGAVASEILRIERLGVSYAGKHVLADVTLSVPSGSIFALIGPSGCGKTSFLNCLNRLTDLVPTCQVKGQILLRELDILHPRTDLLALRRRVGMIFQKPNPFPLSIRENLAFPLREHGCRDRIVLQERVETALRDVGLWDEVKDRLGSSAQALSGGQQQRLCLARALALRPEALLLDEPCSSLDPISSGIVEDLIHGLRGRYTVLIVTHNLAQARRIADQTAFFWLQDGVGKLIEAGPTQQIFESPSNALTAAYVSGRKG